MMINEKDLRFTLGAVRELLRDALGGDHNTVTPDRGLVERARDRLGLVITALEAQMNAERNLALVLEHSGQDPNRKK